MVVDPPDEFRDIVRDNLNKTMIIKQGLSAEQVNRIVELQVSKHYLYKQMENASVGSDHVLLRELAEQAEDLEFLLQTAWDFKQDATHHRFWTMPGCICPVMTNIEKYPSEDYLYTKTCPIHGSKFNGCSC